MMLKIPPPRLLPATILAVAALLLLKGAILTQAALSLGPKPDTTIVATAKATEAPKEHAKPSPAAEVQPVPVAPTAVQEGPPPVSEGERALLQELRQRRQDLDARADAMAVRESVLVATEQKLASRVAELQTLQVSLEHLDAALKQKEDAGWQGLVKVYETMKPKEAAGILNDLAMPVLLPVLDRMKDAKAAAVLAVMNPDKARDVTAELAELRTGRNAPGATARIKSTPSGS
jgi:flagellar motility protein MotE (MotC chaperone)